MLTLHHGDCIEWMRGLPDGCVDAVVTDPPFGVDLEYASFNDTRDAVRRLAEQWLPEARRIAKVVAFTPGKGNEWLYPEPTWTLGWATPAGQGLCRWGFQCHFPILVYGPDPYLAAGLGGRADTLIVPTVKRERIPHPCPKPLEVWRWLVDRVDPTGTGVIADPFMGSGTTAVVCAETGRTCVGAEIDAGYVALAEQRVANTTPPLFGGRNDGASARAAKATLWGGD